MISPGRVPVPRIAVIGGGISGLSAAARIAALRPEADVVVFESSPRAGGKLFRTQVAGAWVDVGAEAMLARRPEGVRAARDAGLSEQLIQPLTTAALLRNRGRNQPLPRRTLIGIPGDVNALLEADVLDARSLAKIANEPGQPWAAVDEDIAIGRLVEQRFGPEVVDRLVDPLLGGVYAGHAREISLQAAMPGLAARLRSPGASLLESTAQIISASERASEAGAPVFASVSGGLARLAEALAESKAFQLVTSTAVRALRRSPAGFVLTLGSAAGPTETTADAVILAIPAAKSATLLGELVPAAATELAGIETASMAIVTLALTREQARGLPAGSGILVPHIEGLSIKAMTFSSQKWPGVGSDGAALMRASLGRAHEEWTLQRTDEELLTLVLSELAEVTGVEVRPIDTQVQRWGGGLPQYAVGHLGRVARIRQAVAQVHGLAVCGAAFDGVGIPACIASAHIAADRVAGELGVSAQ